jgi:hypothetical protein
MSKAGHVTTVQLLARARDPGRRLPSATERHVESCGACRAEMERWIALGRALGAPAEEPPAGTVERAWALMAPRLPRPSERDRFAIARLVFDSRAPGAARALRAHATGSEQVWHTRQADVSVSLGAPGMGETPMLVGAVLPRRPLTAPAWGWAWLMERGRGIQSARVDASGEFMLPAPRGARWTLLLEWGGLRLRLEASP